MWVRTPLFFLILTNMIKNQQGRCNKYKDLKSSHQIRKIFHKIITMIYSFLCVFHIRPCSSETAPTIIDMTSSPVTSSRHKPHAHKVCLTLTISYFYLLDRVGVSRRGGKCPRSISPKLYQTHDNEIFTSLWYAKSEY